MNKVFKVIWSEARNAYVVVSEMAKNHGAKSCSTKKLLAMLIATGVMTCASMDPAMADNPASDDANKGWNLFVNDEMTSGAVEVQPGGYVNLRSDEGNIIVSAKKEFFGPVVNVELSRNLNVDSIHAGDFFMNNDMGIGFGKNFQQDLALIANIPQYKMAGFPLLLGCSRKRGIGRGSDQPEPKARTYGNIAADTVGILGGADIIRLHNIEQEKQGVFMAQHLKGAKI